MGFAPLRRERAESRLRDGPDLSIYRTSAGRSRLSHGSRRWSASPYPGPLVEIRFHELRHTAGTPALRQGEPLHTLSKMLGHSDPAMTLRRYATSSRICARTPRKQWTNFSDPTFHSNRDVRLRARVLREAQPRRSELPVVRPDLKPHQRGALVWAIIVMMQRVRSELRGVGKRQE
jgi:hypothetical protein